MWSALCTALYAFFFMGCMRGVEECVSCGRVFGVDYGRNGGVLDVRGE